MKKRDNKNNSQNNAQNNSQNNAQNNSQNNAQNNSQHNAQNKQSKNSKQVIDLTSYISPESVKSDVNGSYTGVTQDTYFNDELEEPVQDADDL